MKKAIVILAILLIAAVFAVAMIAVRGIMTYPRLALEDVYTSPEKQDIYGIGTRKDPADFGYRFKDEAWTSISGLKLTGWYIPSKKKETDSCYMIIHGRSSNRLKSLKYLEVATALSMNNSRSVFLPDLRNSGLSDTASTAMGWYFAEDIVSAMLYLSEKHGMKKFVLHGFSMGAMGISCVFIREDLRGKLKTAGIVIQAVILDSPVSNVQKNVRRDITETMGLPAAVSFLGLAVFNFKIGGNLDRMALGEIYRNPQIPVLILYAENDDKSPAWILEDELKNINTSAVRSVRFKTGDHARLFLRERDRYIKETGDFFNKIILP